MKSSCDSIAVIGLGFGDEGKGACVSSLCPSLNNPIIVRYSGGQQAGHTVMDGKKRHIFSNFGSGTIHGAPTYWSHYCTIDPVGIMNEYEILSEKGIKPKLLIDRRCPITTPYDKQHNQKTDNVNGTCGVGVGSTFQREEDHYSLTALDLLFPFIFVRKLEAIKEYYLNILGGYSSADESDFLTCCLKIIGCSDIDIVDGPEKTDREKRDFVFEGSQGLLLDQNIGFFPHVTRSNVGSKNILEMGFTPYVYLVTRAFQTRHGPGPMTNENRDHKIKDNTWETNVTNEYQGKFRKSYLDLDLLRYGLEKDPYIRDTKNKELIITCMDLVPDYSYTLRGLLMGLEDEKSFARAIANYLQIEKVTFTSSPFTTRGIIKGK